MKKLAFILALCASSVLADVTDTYDLDMRLRLPQVFDNMKSRGYRKYQTQRVTGKVVVRYSDDDGRVTFSFENLVNHTFKVGGRKVTYESPDDESPNWVYIGNNGTGVFKTPCAKFCLECEPSYVEGLTDDSALILTCAGFGSSAMWKCCRIPAVITGYASGTLGCGCAYYGRTSPTRHIWYCGPLCSSVSAVAPVYGKFKMKFVKSERRCD